LSSLIRNFTEFQYLIVTEPLIARLADYVSNYGDYTHYLVAILIYRVDIKSLAQPLIDSIVQLLELLVLKCSNKNLSIIMRALRTFITCLPNTTIFKIFDRVVPTFQ
jgi:hypothetical protein